MKRIAQLFLTVLLAGTGPSMLCAADAAKPAAPDVCVECRRLEEEYAKKEQFRELADKLSELARKNKKNPPCVDYYMALARYRQLKSLEEKQSWDEYFSRGNEYRDAVVENAQKAVNAASPQDPYGVYARLLLWQFHKDQQDTFVEDALSDLVSSALAFAKSGGDIQVVKDAADTLFSREEKVKARALYQLYVDRVAGADTKEEDLLKSAQGFVKSGNTELAQALYDAYLARISKSWPKEKLVPVLVEIAKAFSYKDEGVSDPEYAEKMFARIIELAGADALSQELLYLRAFNFEKSKNYPQAKAGYQELLRRYPSLPGQNLVLLKLGLISAYCLGDVAGAKEYFQKVAADPKAGALASQAFYHLGLLSQWADALDEAKKFYASSAEPLAKERLEEIEEARPIEYNLKTFLDAALKSEGFQHDRTKLFLRSSPSLAKVNQEVAVGSMPYLVQTGCLVAEMQYLWSGNLGSAHPGMQEASFKTTYPVAGVKEIFVVVVSATGVVDWDVDLVDVQ